MQRIWIDSVGLVVNLLALAFFIHWQWSAQRNKDLRTGLYLVRPSRSLGSYWWSIVVIAVGGMLLTSLVALLVVLLA